MHFILIVGFGFAQRVVEVDVLDIGITVFYSRISRSAALIGRVALCTVVMLVTLLNREPLLVIIAAPEIVKIVGSGVVVSVLISHGICAVLVCQIVKILGKKTALLNIVQTVKTQILSLFCSVCVVKGVDQKRLV